MHSWVSAYIYSNFLDNLLVDGLVPFLNNPSSRRIISRYFFIRYEENGQHLRLRLLVPIEKIQIIKDEILKHFEQYFEPKADHRNPNFGQGSVQFVDYEPEIERYGGDKGIRIAEYQFYVSSQVTLSLLSMFGINQQKMLGAAIQLELGLLFAADYTEFEVYLFCQRQYELLCKSFLLDRSVTDHHEMIDDISKSYILDYKTQIDLTSKACVNFWQDLKRCKAQEALIKYWISEMSSCCNSLDQIANLHSFQYPEGDENFNIMTSYIHMTNNRLGIPTFLEPYLAFLTMNAFDKWRTST